MRSLFVVSHIFLFTVLYHFIAFSYNIMLEQGAFPMVGIGFFFTPLFSMTMSSVAPNLYSHASATVGSLQQVAGAAGTAIFITVFTIVGKVGQASDATAAQSTINGTKAAFVLGSIMWLVTIALAFAIRADKKSDAPAVAAH
mgnify:CR=1 FL=1